jgi:hypothetical protein
MLKYWFVLTVLVVGCGEANEEAPAGDGDAGAGEDAPMGDAEIDSEVDASSPDVAPDGDVEPDVGDRACSPTAGGELPEGLVTLEWDDGMGAGEVATQDWAIAGVPLATAVLHEQVRFELPHPARVHGFSVQYGALAAGDYPVTAGLYPDFGYNGFDMWHFEPLWEGALCSQDIGASEWVTFVLDEPVVVEHPGLVYVGNRREGEGAPGWMFDGSLPREDCESLACCTAFNDCHSSWNLPEVVEFDGNYSWPGLSLSIGVDYLVRLHVEYTDDVQPGDKFLQPVEGVSPSSRISFGDYDGDGDDDFLTNGPRLWRNDGTGMFEDVTDSSGIAGLGVGGSGGVWGDYDNDGCLDLYLFVESGTAADHLLHNECDGTFTEATEASGISDLQAYNGCDADWTHTPSPAAAWWDYDADGWLDLYVGGFICWEPGTYFTDKVWHNEGDGTFTEATGLNGFRGYEERRFATRGASPIDFDLDGDVDLLAHNYRLHPNLFYRNNAGESVSDTARTHGLDGAVSSFGNAEYFGHTIGVAWGDLNNDGRFDLIESNLAHPRFFDFSDKTRVLLYQLGGQFHDIQGDWNKPYGDAGLRYQETHSVPVLGDFDQDGNLDLAISAVYDGRPTDFYWGNGDGTFRLDNYHAGIEVRSGWGMAVSDIDGDGDLDLAASGVLYRNTLGDKGHWLAVSVVGNAGSNRAALGATVRLHTAERVFVRHVGGGTGQGCQNSQVLHYGLGEVDSIDRIEARFPGGEWLVYDGPIDVDRRITLFEDGTLD